LGWKIEDGNLKNPNKIMEKQICCECSVPIQGNSIFWVGDQCFCQQCFQEAQDIAEAMNQQVPPWWNNN